MADVAAGSDIQPLQQHPAVYYHVPSSSQAPLYRLVRLRALSESPARFGSSFARELAFPLETWQTRLANPDAVLFVATRRDILRDEDALGSDDWTQPAQFEASDRLHYGMICCIRSFEDPTDARIVSFWVAPSARRKGVGKALIQMTLSWASSRNKEGAGFENVLLDVKGDNVAARNLYEVCGFKSLSTSNPAIMTQLDTLRYVYRLY